MENQRRSRAAVAWMVICVCVVSAAAWRVLPHGIFIGDSGDNQVASALLGIQHPPGYPLLSLIGHPFTRLFSSDPPFGVTVLNWFEGIVVLVLTIWTLSRLGAGGFVALPAALALAAVPLFWIMWAEPEVYMPSLLMLVCMVLAFIRWERTRSRWAFAAAWLCMGSLLVTRNSTLPYIGVLALASIVVIRRMPGPPRRVGKDAVIAFAALVAPLLIALGFVWMRDQPDARYDYMNQRVELAQRFDSGAKLDRLTWLVTARQYWADLGGSAGKKKSRVHELLDRLTSPKALALPPILLLMGIGAAALRRGKPGSLILLTGVFVAEAAFLSMYRVFDADTMALPIIWVAIVLAACGAQAVVARMAPTQQLDRPSQAESKRGKACVFFSLVAMLICTGVCIARTRHGPRETAPDFGSTIDWAALPQRATIFIHWDDYPSAKYAQLTHGRDDLHLTTTGWLEANMNELSRTAAIYAIGEHHWHPRDWSSVQEHGLWHLIPLERRLP